MMLPIQSSMFSHIGYDADSMTLTVRFNPTKKSPDGDLYEYPNVVPEKWAEMQAAESAGKWFLANIKGQYEGKKVEPYITAADLENGITEVPGTVMVFEDDREPVEPEAGEEF